MVWQTEVEKKCKNAKAICIEIIEMVYNSTWTKQHNRKKHKLSEVKTVSPCC